MRALRALNPGLRTAAIGVSIGPLHTSLQRKRLADYLSGLDYVSVRDEPSFRFLQEAAISCRYDRQFDVAALLLDIPGVVERLNSLTAADTDTSVIGLAPCHVQRYRGGDPDVDLVRCRKLADGLRQLATQRRLHLRLFEFNGDPAHGDRHAINTLRELLGGCCSLEVVGYRPDPIHFLAEIGRCRVLIGMRLHSVVFAYLRNVPLVVLSYHPKCAGFADEIGLCSDQTLDADTFAPTDLARAVEAALVGTKAFVLPLDDALASARMNLELFLANSGDNRSSAA